MAHWSDCSLHNGPALPAGPCDCGNSAPEPNATTVLALQELERGRGKMVYSLDDLLAGMTEENLYPEI